MAELAVREDVVAALGRGLTPTESTRVEHLLAQASELFRKHARRTFTPGRSTVRLKVNGGEVRLPETPVATVHSVTTDDGAPVTYTQFQDTLTTALRAHQFVRVDYSHGATEIPQLVITTVAGMVERVLNVDDRARSGLSQYQTTAGPYQGGGTFAAWAVGGQMMMSPADMQVAESFRPPRLTNTVVLQ